MATIADNLLSGVKRRISMPASQVLLDDSDILSFSDNVIQSKIVPLYESTNQEFFVTSVDVSLVASTSDYSVPYRAVGRALRDLKLKDTATGTHIRSLPKIAIEDLDMYLNYSLPSGFYFKGDNIHIVPDIDSSYTGSDKLEVWYRLAPSKLTLLENVATVVSVASPVVTVNLSPSTFSSLTPLDFIKGKSGNSILSIDKTPVSVTSTEITFASADIPSQLEAGDYIALAGYSPVVNMISDEAYPYLESNVAKRCLKAIGDYEGSRELDEDISDEKKALLMLLEPRISGEPTIIINRTGLVRGNKFDNRGWLHNQ